MKDTDLERGSIPLSQCWSLAPHLRFSTGAKEGRGAVADEAERDRRSPGGEEGNEGPDRAKVRAEGEN